jgi:hypothetical protein
MANVLKRMILKSRLEAKTGLGSGTATVYIAHFEAEDKGKQFYIVWGAAAPSTNFDTAPAGSMYIDYVLGSAYIKDVASGWTELT